ncbi:hypothetical protein AB4865_00020 [Capnocytophaga sp. ARDL2]|uniref:hypothetical protein n=1 Tax=Capnocytophaga sp. ARDL2 TaxID=3238809 RepID=UPI003558197F
MNTFSTFLITHSYIRWVILLLLFIAVFRSYIAKKRNYSYTKTDNVLRIFLVGTAHVQLLLGYYLYFNSVIVNYFLENFSTAVKMREVRFFGMEHITAMTIAVVLLTIGAMKVKKQTTDFDKHKKGFSWYLTVLLIVLVSIPWGVLFFTYRPLFRLF